MEHDISLPSREISLPESWKRLPVVAGIVGVLALAASYFLAGGDSKQFAFSYLTGFYYWLTLALCTTLDVTGVPPIPVGEFEMSYLLLWLSTRTLHNTAAMLKSTFVLGRRLRDLR